MRYLDELRWHWDEAYKITIEGGKFRAERLDNGGLLESDTAPELREMMQHDYAVRPVARKRSIRGI